jgi:hypothetical protein
MNQYKWTIISTFLSGGEVQAGAFQVKATQCEIEDKLKELQVKTDVVCTVAKEFWLESDDVFFKGFSPIQKALEEDFPVDL